MALLAETDTHMITKTELKGLKPRNGIARIDLRYKNGETTLSVFPFKSLDERIQREVDPFIITVNCDLWKSIGERYECKEEDLKPLNGWLTQDGKDSPLHTIVSLLREGDEIDVRWYEAHNNGYLDQASYSKIPAYTKLYKDEVKLSIRRPKRGREREDTNMNFLVATCVCADSPTCPDNSARMLRRGYFDN
jgi:hypothetical protein